MTVFIDADACPVMRIAERVAREHNIIFDRVFSSPLIRAVQNGLNRRLWVFRWRRMTA